MTQLIQRSFYIALSLTLLNLAGCAAPASKESMAAQNLTLNKKHPYSIGVSTKGGTETGSMDSSSISDADLKAAIESSIIQSSLFKSVVQGKSGDYDLTVSIVQISKPMFGLDMKVDLETGWTLVKTSDKSVVMQKLIRNSYTATPSDAFVGMTRLRLAVEGAARENIAQGLKAIAELNL